MYPLTVASLWNERYVSNCND